MYNYFKNKIIWIFLLTIFPLQGLVSQKISKSVQISSGAVNGVFIKRAGKTLVVYGDPKNEIKKAEMILFTHFRRDVVWAGRNLVQKGALAIVPTKEKGYFTKGDSIWTNFVKTRFHDYYNQTTKIGILPLKVHRFVQGGEILKWQDLDIKVLNTPGYTRGSVSYIADIDKKRFAFVGDLIYGDGKILDLYSFQDSLGRIRGYHGYAVRLGQLLSSLHLIAEQKPDFLIPSRGPIITDPDSAIQKLTKLVSLLYQNYLFITAQPSTGNILLNHVLGPSVKVDFMPSGSVIENPPSWYMHISNSNLVFAEDSSAFLIDCGTTESIFKRVLQLKQDGRLKSLDGIFITHYHDDHTDFLKKFVKEFNCPVYVTKELKDILENPSAYRVPCLTTDQNKNLTIMQNGQEMSWKDYTLTFYYFPGQTIYHDAALFRKRGGESIFFIGDSFTQFGIDDYCLLNRNLLRNGNGYLYCLDILKKLPEDILLSNQHIARLFSFSRQQLDYMTNVLLKRIELLKNLFPWDDVNYGLDEQWVSVYPYGLRASPGQTIDFSVKIFNYSDKAKTFIVGPNVPTGLIAEPKLASLIIEPGTEGEQKFKLSVSKQVLPGVSLLTVNLKFDGWDLREWSEGLIEILP